MNEVIAKPENPYAAPSAQVHDTFAQDQRVLADRLVRLGAKLIDSMVWFVAFIPIIVSITAQPDHRASTNSWILAILMVLGLIVYNCVLLQTSGQTIGKKLLSIQIVRGDGSSVGLARVLFIRALPVGLLSLIPFIGFLVSLTDILLIFREDQRCLHDQIADTLVVKI